MASHLSLSFRSQSLEDPACFGEGWRCAAFDLLHPFQADGRFLRNRDDVKCTISRSFNRSAPLNFDFAMWQ